MTIAIDSIDKKESELNYDDLFIKYSGLIRDDAETLRHPNLSKILPIVELSARAMLKKQIAGHILTSSSIINDFKKKHICAPQINYNPKKELFDSAVAIGYIFEMYLYLYETEINNINWTISLQKLHALSVAATLIFYTSDVENENADMIKDHVLLSLHAKKNELAHNQVLSGREQFRNELADVNINPLSTNGLTLPFEGFSEEAKNYLISTLSYTRKNQINKAIIKITIAMFFILSIYSEFR